MYPSPTCCCPISTQNNQLEKIYPEELARLQRLETLNLQNNRLTSRGEECGTQAGNQTPEKHGGHGENLQTPGRRGAQAAVGLAGGGGSLI